VPVEASGLTGGTAAAREWMRDKVPALEYRRPIDMLDSDADAQAVIQMPAGLSEKMNNLCFDIPAKKW
jgi:uncharacterized protein (DUF2384 family)